jgi:CubicO group peptidase (beta-lactamase class C family)
MLYRTLPLLAALTACGATYPVDERITVEPARGEVEAFPTTWPVSHGTTVGGRFTADVDDLVTTYLRRSDLPGASIVLVKNGEVVHTAGYGWADLAVQAPMTARTPISLASVSKTFLGVTSMQAIASGRLELDASVSDLLSFDVVNPHRPDAAPTFRHLVTHSAGLFDSDMYYGQFVQGDAEEPLEAYVADVLDPTGAHYSANSFLDVAPGTEGVYSNMSAGLAGTVLAELHGIPFKDVVRRDVWEPLGMNDTAFKMDALLGTTATGYSHEKGALVTWLPFSHPNYADGMLRSCADDMGRYMTAIQNDTLLSSESREAMWMVDPDVHPQDDGQGVMWARRVLDGRDLRGHSGYHYGTSSEMWLDIESGSGFLLALNANPRWVDDARRVALQRRLLDLVDAL